MMDRRDIENDVEQKAHDDKELSSSEGSAEAPIGEDSLSEPVSREPESPAEGPVQRTGRWTPDENILFLYGLKRFGKGRWKKMSIYLPHRYVFHNMMADSLVIW